MKKINRIISAATVVALSLGVFTGCGSATDASSAKAQTESKTTSSASADSKDSGLNQARTIRIGDQNPLMQVSWI